MFGSMRKTTKTRDLLVLFKRVLTYQRTLSLIWLVNHWGSSTNVWRGREAEKAEMIVG